jgi:hypothetical protein
VALAEAEAEAEDEAGAEATARSTLLTTELEAVGALAELLSIRHNDTYQRRLSLLRVG